MGIGGDPTGVVHTQKGPLPGSEDASFNEGLLPLAEIPAPRTDHELACFLRRATGPRFLAVYLAGLVLVVLALAVCIAVLKSSQCPNAQVQAEEEASIAENVNSEVLPPCGEGWIGFRNKCYFFSEQEANWTDAEHACASLNSSLAVIDNQREMDFLMRYNGKFDHWIGLWRESGQRWVWVNGSEFNEWFQIKDFSDYAFLNHNRVGSAERHNVRNWICSR